MDNKQTIKKDGSILKIFEGLLYILYVILGFYLAFLIRFNLNPSYENIKPFIDCIPYIILASFIIFYFYNIVSTLRKPIFENAIIILISLALIDIISIAIVFFNRGFAFPRSIFLIGFVLQFILIFVTKLIILKILKARDIKKDILIIASKDETELIAKRLLLDKYNPDKVKYISEMVNSHTYELINLVDKVYIGSSVNEKDKIDLIKYSVENDKSVYLVPSFFEISLVGSKISLIGDLPTFKIEQLGLTFEQRIVKRIIDIIGSFIGIIITSPIMLIVSIIVKLYDGGPVLYKQERVTKDNKVFNIYKFRTMIVNAEAYTGPILATDKDPRITPIGRFLRASRLDELPQMFNVLKGDMSIVGPRPERPFFVEQFKEEIDNYKYRTCVKAGITGLAQVLGNYATDPKIKAQYDLLYIKNYSLMLDIKIILDTLKIIFLKDSSKGIASEQRLEEIYYKLNLKAYEEMGATRLEHN